MQEADMKALCKAVRLFYQLNKYFPFLRQAVILFFCVSAFTFPLFGQEDVEELTQALREAIPESSYDEMNIREIIRLLDAGADANGEYPDAGSAEKILSHAAKTNNVQLAQVLLDHGADPLLMWDGICAVFYGNERITELFISHNARYDVQNYSGMSPLLWHADRNISSALLILEWEQQHSPNFNANFENRKNYMTAVLASLLNRKFSGDMDKNDIAKTYAFTERLLNEGANAAALDWDGGFPVAYFALRPHAQFIFPMLVERGAPVDALDQYGQTALYCATLADNFDLANFLIKRGVDINRQGSSGQTALMGASSEKMMRLLLNSGADPNIQDNEGETVLMKSREPEFISLLLQARANPAIKDKNGRTVLHHFIGILSEQNLDDLISHGLPIDEPDIEGFTPLIYAANTARDSNQKFILTLLKKGADPNYRGPNGKTALHAYLLDTHWRYYTERDLEIITAFLEAGTRTAIKDDKGDSALITAIRISKKNPLISDLVQQYADANDIKTAKAVAAKMIRDENKEERRKELAEYIAEKLPLTLIALCIPLILWGVSFVMRRIVFKKKPSANIMGTINAILTLVGSGLFLGLLIGAKMTRSQLDPLANAITGMIIGGVIGVVLVFLPSIRKAFTNKLILYYSPAILSALIVSVVIIFIWF
jgi:ankyrin repeat protein